MYLASIREDHLTINIKRAYETKIGQLFIDYIAEIP